MDNKEVFELLLKCNVSQLDIAQYLGITRQTVSKLSKGEYVNLSSKTKIKLKNLENRSSNDIENMIRINKNIEEISKRILKGDSKYLTEALEGINYMHYWLTDDKFINQENYHTYYFGHMNNFYPRYNQASLFMRDTLNWQKYPLVTYQVDYERKLILNFCIKEFIPKYSNKLYDISNINFPISFEEFVNELDIRIKPSFRFLLYLDYKDDDWSFILQNIKKQKIHSIEFYDLSRLFNFLDNEQAYYGPLIENVLDQFRVQYDFGKLLSDCHYRANKIVEVVNMASLEDLYRMKHDKSSRLFDSHGLKRDNEYMKKERRILKKGI